MKLNHDCVRDLMLYLESNHTLEKCIIVNNINLKNYDTDTILYTADQLIMSDFLNGTKSKHCRSSPMITVNAITPKGHEFLSNIRNKNTWTQIKNILSKATSISLDLLFSTSVQVAKGIATKLIKDSLNLP